MTKAKRPRRDWMHDPAFDAAALAEFERRLARARPASRPGYLRVKGASLLATGSPQARQVAITLLRRVVEEYENFLEVPWSHELLGEAYGQEGNLHAAERHYRACLATADKQRNGTSNVTELFLAEVLLEQRRVTEAVELLSSEFLHRHLLWNSHIFRFCVAQARLQVLTGGDPRPWAERALSLARDPAPQLSRHPKVGLVKTDQATLDEMRKLAPRGDD